MKILAFYAPYTGAGKSLAAQWMAQGERPFYRTSFAKPILEAAIDFVNYPWETRQFEIPEDKEAVIANLGVSLRDMLIAFGAAGRKLHPDFWVRLMEQNMRECPHDYVIDDLRFPNEYEFLRRRGARIVRITNPGREIVASETEALLEGCDFDAEIVNEKKSVKAYARQLDTLGRNLFPEWAQWFTAGLVREKKEYRRLLEEQLNNDIGQWEGVGG